MSDRIQPLNLILEQLLPIVSNLKIWCNMQSAEQNGRPRQENLETGLQFAEKSPAAIAIQLLKAMDQRSNFLSEDLFGDPAWCLLLDLYIQGTKNRKVSISSACIAARVPPTTGLRWINILVDRGYIIRIHDKFDARRVYLELTAQAVDSMTNYLLQVGENNRVSTRRSPPLLKCG